MDYPRSDIQGARYSISSTSISDDKRPAWSDEADFPHVRRKVVIHEATAISDFPEGGLRAWSVVFGSALLTFSTFGIANAWAFQEHYQRTILSHESPSTIAWIGSIEYALTFLPCVVSGRLTDRGHLHGPLIVASVIFVTSIFLTGECKEYWQFMLCQGVAFGLSAGFLFGSFPVTVAHWFKVRRALGYGMVACGASVGGVVFPITVRKLLPLVGFTWTMRITGFIVLFTLSLGMCLVRLRLPPRDVKGGLFNFGIFKNPAYAVYGLGTFIGFTGLYTVLTYIDVAASQVGINPDIAFYLIAIANGCSAIGRVVASWLAIQYGAMNVLLPFSALAGVLTWSWPYINQTGSYPGLVVLAIFYGASSGAFVGVSGTPMSHPAFGEMGDLGRRTGMLWSICALGALVGPPISGAINTAAHGWTFVGWYAGSACMASVVLTFTSRYLVLGSFIGKV